MQKNKTLKNFSQDLSKDRFFFYVDVMLLLVTSKEHALRKTP